jgi:hypothetical protein
MRGRDVSRPHPEHEVEAEQLVQVSYRPRTTPRPPLPGAASRPRAPRRDQPSGNAGGSPDAS